MAKVASVAIGYGIPAKELWTMTFAEILEEIELLGKARADTFRFFDLLNGKRCSEAAALKGVKSKPLDYMVTEPIDAPAPQEPTPEELRGKIDMLVAGGYIRRWTS